MGIDLGRLVVVVALVLAALILRKAAARLLALAAGRLMRRQLADQRQAVLTALALPAQLLSSVVALLVLGEFVLESPRGKDLVLDLAKSLIVFQIYWGIYAVISPLVQRINHRSTAASQSMLGLATTVARILVLGLGLATLLDIWGIKVGPILAGFGLVGAAVALGAQNLFKNLFGGIFIIAEKRFEIGDWIRVDGVVEGTVEFIGLRTTRIRRFDLAPEFVPNSALSDNQVTNFQKMTYRQISWMIGLTYDTTPAQLQRIQSEIAAYIRTGDDFALTPDAAPLVYVDSFGDSAINLMVYCFTRTTDWESWLKIKEALLLRIMDIVTAAGSGFAFPSQSLYVESLPAGLMQGKVPPGDGGNDK